MGKYTFAIFDADGEIVDGARGWAIGESEAEARERAIHPYETWSLVRAIEDGHQAKYNPQGWFNV